MIKYNYTKYKEKLQRNIARLLPKWLLYYAGIRIVENATTGEYSKQNLHKLTAMAAIDRLKYYT